MRNKGFAARQRNIPVPIIALAIAFIILIASVNLIVVRALIKKNAEGYLDNQLSSFHDEMDLNISKLRKKSLTFDFETDGKIDDGLILETLKESTENSALYNFYYITRDGTLYDSDGKIDPGGGIFADVPKVRNVLFNDGFYVYCMEDKNAKDGTVVGVRIDYADKGNEEIRGYYILTIELSDIVTDNQFNNFGMNGQGCLVDEEGFIDFASEGFTEEYGEGENFYDIVLSHTDGGASSTKKIQQMRRFLSVDKKYTISCKGTDGRQVLIKGIAIDGAGDLYLVVIYENGALDNVIMPVLLSIFICSVGIFMALFFIIMLQMMINYRNLSRMEELAYTDEVTGGNNINYFKIKAPELITENSESHYVIVRFDIANFRYINEAYGHASADDILRSLFEKFEEVYSKKEICARINSDQFIALVLNETEFVEKQQRFEKEIGDYAKEIGVKYPIRLKKGIYQVHKEDRNIDIMIDHANAARKSLKGDEKLLEAMYSENIINEMKKNDAIVSPMQPALTKGEFKPYLQPKWDILKDKIVGAEILVRWIKDDGSMVYPSDFIPIFEQNGFVEKLDFYMLECLCEQIRKYKDSGEYNIVPISINQSRILLGNPEYLKNVERIMKRYDTSIEDIQIEITESVFFNDREKMISVVDQLKEMGLVLCMDDFGSGYSSLNILKDIPFDILKIDKDFFSETKTSNDTKMIMHRIVEMALDLGIQVVCEGVETAEQIEILKEIGCTMVQGYYYGKPKPIDEFFEEYLLLEPGKEAEPEKTESTDAEGTEVSEVKESAEEKEEKISEEKVSEGEGES